MTAHANPDAITLTVDHYRAGSLRHTFTLAHDWERPPVDVYQLALAAGHDDEFKSVRADGARLDWELIWQEDRVIVDCTPYKKNEETGALTPMPHYVMIVPLWPVNLSAPDKAFHISGIGMGWHAYRVERSYSHKELVKFQGVNLATNETKRADSGVLAGVDWSTQTALVRVDDSVGRWWGCALAYAVARAK